MKFVAKVLIENLSHFPFSVTPYFLEVAIIELFMIPRKASCCKFSTLTCPTEIQLLHSCIYLCSQGSLQYNYSSSYSKASENSG